MFTNSLAHFAFFICRSQLRADCILNTFVREPSVGQLPVDSSQCTALASRGVC